MQLITSTQRRGAETFASNLEGTLRARGRTVSTLALESGGPDGLPHEAIADGTTGVIRLAALVRRRLDDTSVLVAHGSRTLPVSALATAMHPVPFLYRNIGDPRFWVANQVKRLRVTALLRRAAGIAALWPRAAEDLQRFHGVPSRRVRIIPNAVPAEDFPLRTAEDRHAARATYAIDGEGPVIAYIGSISHEKAPDIAVAAAAGLGSATLLVAGEGPMRAGLQDRTQGAANVRFLGQVADPHRVLAAADVLVLTSKTEGMPAVLIEAGLRGLPVVATDVGGIREIVEDGETGLLVRPGDIVGTTAALRRALDSGNEMGLAGRERCLQRFTMDKVAVLWDGFLSDVERQA